MAEYFLSNGEEPFGPFTATKLIEMGVSRDTAVRAADSDEWRNAAEVDDIAEGLPPAEDPPSIASHEPEGTACSASGPARSAGMHWGLPFKDDGPIGPGLRKYSAILWGIPDKQDWETACYAMPATINGHFFQRPTRCAHGGFNMWGEWHVPDQAMDGWNAVVFLIPNVPLEAGHVGWGFKLSNGNWCWGATENAGFPPFIPPPFPNGAFVEQGTKDEMLRAFRDGHRKSGNGKPWRYERMKLIRALNPHPEAAEIFSRSLPTTGYNLIGNNCMDHSVRILNVYGGLPIVPIPITQGPHAWFPRIWFGTIPGVEKAVSEGF